MTNPDSGAGDGTHDRGLDPARDPARWESAVRWILAAAESELARRSAQADPLVFVLRWSRPILSVAAGVAAVASATLLATGMAIGTASQGESVSASDPATTRSLAEALVSPTVAAWLVADRSPTLEEVVEALEGGG